MSELGNDRWQGEFPVDRMGHWLFSLKAGVDDLGTWAHDLEARVTARQDVALELEVGARLLSGLADRAKTRRPARCSRTLPSDCGIPRVTRLRRSISYLKAVPSKPRRGIRRPVTCCAL